MRTDHAHRLGWRPDRGQGKASTAYHAWIITPLPGGTHLWTEETMQGPLWIELAKQDPAIFWRTHETLLRDLAKVAIERARA